MAKRCVATVLCILFPCHAFSADMLADPGDGIQPKRLVLTCRPFSLAKGTAYCETPHLQLRAGTWDTARFNFNFQIEQAGWRLTGNARAEYSGQEIFDVTVTGQTGQSIFCQWHTEGSKQLFGPGGWVEGYCWAPATNRP